MKKVAIVGAGPGGLAAAILLARSGVDVTVVEKRSHVGGRTSTIHRDGFKFDTGPTFFLYPRVLREIFASAGFDLEAEIPMERLDPQYRLVYGAGGELLATPDVERMAAEIRKLSPHDAEGFYRFMNENRVKLEKFVPFLEAPFESWRDLVHPDMLRLLPLLRPWRSLDSELSSYFHDERIRLGFSFQSKYLGMSPFSCPSLFSILSFLEYEHGVFHPIGGCGSVSEAMARVARSLGVRILLNEPVEGLIFEGRKAVGVRTSERTLAADSVVINADFADAMRTMVPDKLRRKWTDKKIQKKRFSCSTFMMYLGIEGMYEDLSHHTIYLAKNYREGLRDIEENHRLSADPSFYVQNACVTDPTLAPNGMSTLYVLLPVTHDTGSVDWAAEQPRFRALAIEQMKKIGIHDVERRIRTEKILTPTDWTDDYGLYRGATFSMSHSLRQMLHLRPHNRFEDLDSVYLVGGGTHPGSGLPVIFESARITARLLLEDLDIEPQFNTEPVAIGTPPPDSVYETVS
ncbi:phytoene desaturase family protein [Acidipila sp. EB88]|uniref:phytoene desaturase family protein n=1 Tax=Acidipila sp. EB88 TaxID=2305226 RepID=UPI000F5DCAE0|nr:phytoene desaturase family protein [Acidipila sp. EB88]RRA47914.1 phytoene desaturase [Acidipila sp. EB88]